MSMTARTGAYGTVTFIFDSRAEADIAHSVLREGMIPMDLSPNRITVDLEDFEEAETILKSARLKYRAV